MANSKSSFLKAMKDNSKEDRAGEVRGTEGKDQYNSSTLNLSQRQKGATKSSMCFSFCVTVCVLCAWVCVSKSEYLMCV